MNIEAELQIHQKETYLILESGINYNKTPIEQTVSVRKSNSLPFARQIEKLESVSYFTKNDKKKTKIYG